MSERMTDMEFVGKVEWEGGFVDALDYGLTHEHLSPDSKLYPVVREAAQLFQRLAALERDFYDIADEVSDDE